MAAAAYRANERLKDKFNSRTENYSGRKERVHSEIILPPEVSNKFKDREYLWNQVEGSEKRKNSQLAREVLVALPKELSKQERIEVTRNFVQKNFTSQGLISDISIHRGKGTNPHAHILCTTRKAEGENLTEKNREVNRKEKLIEWRESWEKEVNRLLPERKHITALSYGEIKERLNLGDKYNFEPNKRVGREELKKSLTHLERMERTDSNRDLMEKIYYTKGRGISDLTRPRAEKTIEPRKPDRTEEKEEKQEPTQMKRIIEKGKEIKTKEENSRPTEQISQLDRIMAEGKRMKPREEPENEKTMEKEIQEKEKEAQREDDWELER